MDQFPISQISCTRSSGSAGYVPQPPRIDFDVEILDSLNVYQILPVLVVWLKDKSPGESAAYFLSKSADTFLPENSVIESD